MIEQQLEQARLASLSLLELDEKQINDVLQKLADALEANTEAIIAANAKDLSRMDQSDYRYDRLLLNAGRIAGIASDTRNVASLPSPLHIRCCLLQARKLEDIHSPESLPPHHR